MATQVTHEGSDMEVYQVGKVIKEKFPVLESYDMTLEASVTKMMWVLGQTQDIEECRKLFFKHALATSDLISQKKKFYRDFSLVRMCILQTVSIIKTKE